MAEAGAAGFTVGTAALSGEFPADGEGVTAQVQTILSITLEAARRSTAPRRIGIAAHNERKAQLADHEAGRSLLSGDDHARVTKQVEAFGEKLKTMKEMTDRDRSEMLQREMEMMDQINSRTGAHRRKMEL